MINKEPLKIQNHTLNIDGDGFYASPVTFFILENNYYPSLAETKGYINVDEFLNQINKLYKDQKEPITCHIADDQGEIKLYKGIYFLKKELVLELDINTREILPDEDDDYEYDDLLGRRKRKIVKGKNVYKASLTIYHGTTIAKTEVQKLVDCFWTLKENPKQKGELNYLISTEQGLDLKTLKLPEVNVNLKHNYGSNFEELHEYIIGKMSGENQKSKGLVLFYGLPGTGKTYYIRQLIRELSDKKKVIYIAPDMVSAISDPKLLPFLMEHKNSILVVEDAENILKSRKGGGSQGVANILNLADGLLGDGLSIQLICTFNCSIGEIDEALLRKGRLIAKHEFKELSKEDSQIVLDDLGIEHTATGKMTLAEIFNVKDKSFVEVKKGIGF